MVRWKKRKSPSREANGYGQLLDHLPVAVYRARVDGRLVASNRAFRDLLGYDAVEDISGLDLLEHFARRDAGENLLDEVSRSEVRRDLRLELRRRDGRPVTVAADITSERDDSGRVTHFDGVFVDVSDQVRTEARVERLARILDELDNEIYLYDAESFSFVEVSDGARRNLGYSSSELEEMRPWSLLPEYDAERFKRLVEPLRHGEKTGLSVETVQRRKNGSVYPVEIRLQLLARESPPLLASIALDITDRQKLAEHLRLSQRMEAVGVLAGGLAHDFNNLLTAIRGHADLALERRATKGWPDTHFEVIRRAADRGAALTRQVLAFSRQQVLRPKILSLNDIVLSIDPLLRSTLGEDVRLRLELDPELGPVRVDPGQMEEVLINLAINSRDSMPRGGTFTIETRDREITDFTLDERIPIEPGSYVLLIVADTGTGMSEEARRRAFEPFFTTKGPEGTGLGLAMIYGIVKQSDGFIWIESEPGQGTRMTICLPRVEADEPGDLDLDDDSAGAPTQIGNETILLVEDDELVRELVRSVLEAKGFTVLLASTAEAALADYGDREGIHLLVTDVVLPGLPGTELVRRFASERPLLRALFISGYANEKLRREGFETMRVPLLEKPFSPRSLLRAVRGAIDSSQGPVL